MTWHRKGFSPADRGAAERAERVSPVKIVPASASEDPRPAVEIEREARRKGAQNALRYLSRHLSGWIEGRIAALERDSGTKRARKELAQVQLEIERLLNEWS